MPFPSPFQRIRHHHRAKLVPSVISFLLRRVVTRVQERAGREALSRRPRLPNGVHYTRRKRPWFWGPPGPGDAGTGEPGAVGAGRPAVDDRRATAQKPDPRAARHATPGRAASLRETRLAYGNSRQANSD